MPINLSNEITASNLSADLITKLNTVISTLRDKHVSKEITITPVIAEKYRFDMHGLFQNELSMIDEFIYPHIRVNGYNCSNSYDGELLKIKIIDEAILKHYLALLKKSN